MYLTNQLTLEELCAWILLWFFREDGKFPVRRVVKVKLIEWRRLDLECRDPLGFCNSAAETHRSGDWEINHCDETIIIFDWGFKSYYVAKISRHIWCVMHECVEYIYIVCFRNHFFGIDWPLLKPFSRRKLLSLS